MNGRGNEHARAWRGYAMDSFELVLWESYYDGSYALPLIDGEPHRWSGRSEDLLPPGAQAPSLLVPYGFAEPLRDALDEMLGRPHDDHRARYEEAQIALMCERQRVDNLLDLHGRIVERSLYPTRPETPKAP